MKSLRTPWLAAPLATALTMAAFVAPAAGAEAQPPSTAIEAIVHVDIEPSAVTAGLPILKAYVRQARSDADVVHIDLLQQSDAPNHFTLVEVLRSRAAYDRFVEQDYVRKMRTDIQPMLGSPFDERLHHAVPDS